MTLLLEMPVGTRGPTDLPRRALPDVGAARGASLFPAGEAPARRNQLREALREWAYERTYARLSRIPAPLPFSRKEIISKLQELDRAPQNQPRLERRLDLQTNLTLLDRELKRAPRGLKGQDRKHQRLLHVWDYVAAHSEHTRLALGDREMRLWYNVGTFFRSDLPPDYLTDFGTSTLWEMAALALGHNAEMQRLVHDLTGQPAEAVTRDVFLTADAPLQKIDKTFRTFRTRMVALTARSDEVLDAREALEFYVDLFSAHDLQSFRRPHPISLSLLDAGVLQELLEVLGAATDDLRRVLVQEYPGGLSGFRWATLDDSQLSALVRLELEEPVAG